MRQSQPDLFATPSAPAWPEGFDYKPALIDEAEERRLIENLEGLDFKPFDFHGFLGKRRVVSFGWRYDFTGRGLEKASAIPAFLLPARERAGAAFGLQPETLQHVLLTEYAAGAAIGWHKDRSVFGDVIGISLLSACTFRFRKAKDTAWHRRLVRLEPRSAYVLSGPARTQWQHHIPPVTQERWSMTFRTLRPVAAGAR